MVRNVVVVLATLLLSAPARAADPAQLCESAKLRGALEFAQCRFKADQVFAKSTQAQADSDKRASAHAKCEDAIVRAYGIAESKYGSRCPTVGDARDVRDYLGRCSADVGIAMQPGGGGASPRDNFACKRELRTALAGTASAEDVRAGKTFTSAEGILRTGSGSVGPVEITNALLRTGEAISRGPGSDGDLQKGTTRWFIDNRDGTVTDERTGLMWEKKSFDGSIHDVRNRYSWSQEVRVSTMMDGTMVTEFLAALNTPPCFGASPANPAGFCDWRIPNLEELESIRNIDRSAFPKTFPAFDTNNCWSTPGCTVKTCSCTKAAPYWSSSTQTSQNIAAWAVDFLTGEAAYQFQSYTWLSVKSAENHVRAVRGGL